MAEITWPGGNRANEVKSETDEPPSAGGILSRMQALLSRTGRNNGPGGRVEELIGRELEQRRVTDPESKPFSHAEMLMLSRLLAFGRHRVEDAMVPRADIIAVEASTSLNELVRTFSNAAHSRLPVYRETLDDPVGMVHIKDILQFLAVPEPDPEAKPAGPRGNGFSLSNLSREILFVPPSMPAAALLVKMQSTRVHMALVIDEYGGTDGLVTIEDLVELIVGEIEDEHDVEESPRVVPCEDGSYIADARIELEDLVKAAGAEYLPETREDDIDTLGGLVFAIVDRVPQRGEIISHQGIEFEVMDADPRRVKRLRIRRSKGGEGVTYPEARPQAAPPDADGKGDRETE